MISCDELRIGNYVMDKFNGLIEVEEIQEDKINSFEGDPEFETMLEDTFPIKPEEYLFLVLGFRKIEYSEFVLFVRNTFHVAFIKGNGKYIYLFRGLESIEIKSIHFLQNLYFMIMNEELSDSFSEFMDNVKNHNIERLISINKKNLN